MFTPLTLSLASGLLTGLSFFHPCLSFLIWFSFSPLFFIFEKTKKAPFYFFISGLVHYLIVIFWLGFVTRLGLIFLLFYLSFYWLIFAWLAKWLINKRLACLSLPALWVILEFLRENMFSLGFGWAIFGYSQYKNIWLIQIADILGVKVISFIIIAINFIVFNSLIRKEKAFKLLLSVLTIFSFCWEYSSFKLLVMKKYRVDHFSVSVIQPNIDQELKWDIRARDFIINRLKNLGKNADSESLLVYPESSWPAILTEEQRIEAAQLAKDLNETILLGAIIKEQGKFYNAALLIDSQGSLADIYRKKRLVPFGEYVPLRRFFSFIDIVNVMGDISAGLDFHVFNYKDKKFGVLICFEDTFPAFVSKFSKLSDFIINITNDAWFGGQPQSSQHLSILTLRAIENRISIIRSANTGISGYVDFSGDSHSFTRRGKEVFVDGVLSFKIPLNFKRSLYNEIGDIFIFICACLVLFVFIMKKNKSNA